MSTPPSTDRSARAWRWVEAAEWDEFVAASPCATPFHTRSWIESFAAYDGRFAARALAIELDQASLLLPLFARRGVLRRGPFARAVAAQPGVYGGPLSRTGALDSATWIAFARALPQLPFGRLDCFGNVLDPLPAEAASALRATTRTTHALELASLPEDPRSTYSKGCKHSLTKSRRAEVRCERTHDIAGYFEVYRDSLRRWGKAPERAYGLELFERLLATPLAELWVVRMPSGEIAAGGLFLFTARHCVWWHGAMRDAFSDACPSNALIHTLIGRARERGCALFDFNPSGGHEGVDSFKRSFGARGLEVPVFSWRSALAARLGGASKELR
ncbi:MAG: GNAT family N-acetyltransferase [Planctomycetes bacterium]|nr:GNAT family N-acetyltransferase [Planctomycetota bacterium]